MSFEKPLFFLFGQSDMKHSLKNNFSSFESKLSQQVLVWLTSYAE